MAKRTKLKFFSKNLPKIVTSFLQFLLCRQLKITQIFKQTKQLYKKQKINLGIRILLFAYTLVAYLAALVLVGLSLK